MTIATEDEIYKIAMVLLKNRSPVTTPDVEDAVDRAIGAIRPTDEHLVDRHLVVKLVESACNVFVPGPTTLDSTTEDHRDWLPERRSEIEWRLWKRYARYLEDDKDWAPASLYRLDDVTDQILGRLEDPARQGAWDRRGMVVGHVQSGKTANYTGLICKAADAGYKLIVVLAGIHDSLRSQTQLRLDEGFLGYDTQQRMQFDQTNTRLGVGLMRGVDFYHVNSMTSSAQKGDFKKSVAQTANVTVGGADPLLLVVKKHKSILNNLIAWIKSAQQELKHGDDRPRVHGVPMLVIDDECDHASVNTKDTFDSSGNFDPELNPTAVNGAIRLLLESLEQSAYVGYTATPFANIFIFKDADTKKFGEDLFPRSFIINLKRPSDYIGASKVFGLDSDPVTGIVAEDALPIARTVSDAEEWIPSRHKSYYQVPAEVPKSLRTALLSFILVCAARIERRQATAHNSMLVHVTRFTAVQSQVADHVKLELSFIKNRIQMGDGTRTPGILEELRHLWEADFVTTTRKFDDGTSAADWSDIEPHLVPATAKIEVKIVNGTAMDALEYFGRPAGVSVIAIGGDKLSRGLTLEGLSVSYYLRTSKMYDTLLQMGRWFGFRPGYADLCRLFTTAELQSWYKQITLANEELLLQFDEMALMGGTPEDFGLRVRCSPDGLMISSAAKIRNKKTMKLSFAGSISETIAFQLDPPILSANHTAVDRLLLSRGDPGPDLPNGSNRVWTAVPGDDMITFLRAYRSHPGATKAQTTVMANYIARQVLIGELVEWTVVLLSNSGPVTQIGGMQTGSTVRQQFPLEPGDPTTYGIRRLVSPADEKIDLNASELESALESTRELWRRGESDAKTEPRMPSGPSIRRARPTVRGLLLIYALVPDETAPPALDPLPLGIAASFPTSETAQTIDYAINNTYWQQELDSP